MHMCSIIPLIFSPCLKCWPDRGRLASGLPLNDGSFVVKHHSCMEVTVGSLGKWDGEVLAK